MRKEEKGNKQMRFYVSKHHDAQAGIHTHTCTHFYQKFIEQENIYTNQTKINLKNGIYLIEGT